MKPTDIIQSLTVELNRLLESRNNLNELPDALWDAGIKLEAEIIDEVKKAVELVLHDEIIRVKAALKGLL